MVAGIWKFNMHIILLNLHIILFHVYGLTKDFANALRKLSLHREVSHLVEIPNTILGGNLLVALLFPAPVSTASGWIFILMS